jgi:hypothetical protein
MLLVLFMPRQREEDAKNRLQVPVTYIFSLDSIYSDPQLSQAGEACFDVVDLQAEGHYISSGTLSKRNMKNRSGRCNPDGLLLRYLGGLDVYLLQLQKYIIAKFITLLSTTSIQTMFLGSKVRRVRTADNLIAICDPIV